jgi:hypothetical protein
MQRNVILIRKTIAFGAMNFDGVLFQDISVLFQDISGHFSTISGHFRTFQYISVHFSTFLLGRPKNKRNTNSVTISTISSNIFQDLWISVTFVTKSYILLKFLWKQNFKALAMSPAEEGVETSDSVVGFRGKWKPRNCDNRKDCQMNICHKSILFGQGKVLSFNCSFWNTHWGGNLRKETFIFVLYGVLKIRGPRNKSPSFQACSRKKVLHSRPAHAQKSFTPGLLTHNLHSPVMTNH